MIDNLYSWTENCPYVALTCKGIHHWCENVYKDRRRCKFCEIKADTEKWIKDEAELQKEFERVGRE